MRFRIHGNPYVILISILFILGLIVMQRNLVGKVIEGVDYQGEGKKMSAMRVEEVLQKYTDNLMSMSGVIGTGQGLCNGEPCVKVFVIKKTPELEEKIPRELEGYKVKIEETGDVRAYPDGRSW